MPYDISEVIKKIQAVPGAIRRAGDKTLDDVAKEIVRIMRRPGLPVKYPITWDSDKQRKKVIAMLRAMGDLPYTRKGGYENAWQERPIDSGHVVENLGHNAVFLAGHPSGNFAGARLVQASGQSHVHQGRWRLIKPVLDAVNMRLIPSILERLRVEIED